MYHAGLNETPGWLEQYMNGQPSSLKEPSKTQYVCLCQKWERVRKNRCTIAIGYPNFHNTNILCLQIPAVREVEKMEIKQSK